jgi:hypothetical protein
MASLPADYNFSKRYTGTSGPTIQSSMGIVPALPDGPRANFSIFKAIVRLHPQPGIDSASSHAFAAPSA